MCSGLLLENFNEAGNTFLHHFYMLYYWLFCLWIVMHNFSFFMFISVRWKMWSFRNHHGSYLDILLNADSRKLQTSFIFFDIPNDLIFAWWVWGLLVQFLDVKLDFVGQCFPGVEIQRQYSWFLFHFVDSHSILLLNIFFSRWNRKNFCQ